MALGPLGTVGLGSTVLSTELLDKIKKAEEDAMLKPYTTKIEQNTAKQKALTELNTKLLAFQTTVSSLGDATAFQKRSVTASVTGDTAAASLSASNGVAVQSLSVKVTQIAQKDVFQSKGFSSSTARVLDNTNTGSSGTAITNAQFTLLQNGKAYVINVNSNDTFEDLAARINDISGGNIVAKVVNTGEAENPFRFTLSSKETGTKNAIQFVDGIKDTANTGYTEDTGAKALFTKLGWELDKTDSSGNTTSNSSLEASKNTGFSLKAQVDPNDPTKDQHYISKAADAKFELDGVSYTRSSNTITDIGAGLTLSLKKTGDINFDVKQDTEEISKALEELVEKYIDLMNQLDSATKFDTTSKVAGELQGISAVTSIRSTIVNTLFKTQFLDGKEKDANGNELPGTTRVAVSLMDYGLNLSEAGVLSFTKTKFDEKVAKDIDFAEKFFSGSSGFEEMNYSSSPKDFKSPPTITSGQFSIVFNGITYDLSKIKSDNPATNGTDFKFNKTEEEAVKELVDHINSFKIEDLKVSYQSLQVRNSQSGQNETQYVLKFNSDNGSDFELKGDEKVLEQMGMKATKISPQIQTGSGVFATLKSTLESMTASNARKKPGTLTVLSEELTKENEALEKTKKSTQEGIDARSETLTLKWIAYDRIIGKLKNQGAYLTQLINATNNNK